MNNQLVKKVLFVCMGNICRSPTAEGVFTSLINEKNISHLIECDSAGTHAYHIGNAPDNRAQIIAKKHNVDLSKLVARKVTTEDFLIFDYIIAMDQDNLSNLQMMQNNLDTDTKASLHLFMEFAPDWDRDDVPDPYYGGDNGFEKVFSMVSDASEGLIKTIQREKLD